ncbi:MAG: class I SAM-dependent methyltransferase [Deltaproteobacteria bacterium]|nr:class I SAM-dependent methyltransferase [Deltaproteobacteria bacterium]
MARKRTPRVDKLAQIYDEEVLPIWSMRFGRMLLRKIETPPQKSMILDVGCGTGYPALEILRKLDDQSRIIAIDCASEMLNVARKKAGDLSGKRIFFRTETVSGKLSFASDVYDVVVANDAVWELDDPRAAIADFARVCKPGGFVLVTMPLQGSWSEFYDIYREVLVKHDHHEILRKLDEELQRSPDPEQARQWLEEAGLQGVTVDTEEFDLLFRSAREFFFAPVIEYGPLPQWKEIAGKGETMQEIFWHIKEAIDAYFGDRAFSVTIKAGCLVGRKPLESERPQVAPKAPPPPVSDDDQLTPAVPVTMPPVAAGASDDTPPGGSAAPTPGPREVGHGDEEETGEIMEISTNEIQVVDEVIESLSVLDDEVAKHDDVLKKK